MTEPRPVSAASKSFLGDFAARYQRKHEELVAKYGSDYDKRATAFSLNKAEKGVVDEWLASLRPEIMQIQKSGSADPIIKGIVSDSDEPYYGATGGGVSYTFIPTSLGTIIVVKETITGKELNVSDALDWFFYG